MITTVLASTFLLLGGGFALVAALGVFRFRDFYARMHAATKASTFGIGLAGLAAAIHFGNWSASLKLGFTVVFLFITIPVAAHLLGKAFYKKSPPDEP